MFWIIVFFNFATGNCYANGIRPSPFYYRPLFFHYEDKWIQKTKRKELVQDDPTAIFDVGEVENVYHEIYTPELDFKHENSSFK